MFSIDLFQILVTGILIVIFWLIYCYYSCSFQRFYYQQLQDEEENNEQYQYSNEQVEILARGY